MAARRRTTIRQRLSVAVMCLVAALVAGLSAFELVELGQFLEQSVAVRVRAQAKPQVDLAATEALTRSAAADLATGLTSADTGAVVLGPDGQVLSGPRAGTIGEPPPKDVPADAVQRALSGQLEVDVVRSVEGSREMLVLIPIPRSTPSGVVVLATSLARADQVARHQILLSVSGLAVVIIVAGLLSPLLVRLALRPLGTITSAATEVAAGDLSRRLGLIGPNDEIGRLASAFDSMTAALEDAFNRLAASEARSRAFVADAGHELRTPLTSLGGYADVLLRRSGSLSAEDAVLLAGLRREVDRMVRLVDALVLLAKTDSVPNQVAEPVDAHALALAVVAQVQPLSGHRELTVVGSPATIVTNPDHVHQILLNLLSNTIRHTPDGSHVTVLVRTTDEVVQLEVADDGPGMDAALRARAFNRFARGTVDAGGNGSGLGLAIVRSLTESLGGDVALHSAPGAGTAVTVTLPKEVSGS